MTATDVRLGDEDAFDIQHLLTEALSERLRAVTRAQADLPYAMHSVLFAEYRRVEAVVHRWRETHGFLEEE
jgi:hypothetical protein